MRVARNIARGLAVGIAVAAVAAVALALPRSAAAAFDPASFPYQPPLFGEDFADPSVLRVGSRYFAYATAASWERGGAFPILGSADLSQWSFVGDSIPNSRQLSWSSGNWWAPSVVQYAGVTFMYYTAKDRASRHHCIGVATARGPRGPFTQRAVITCGGDGAVGAIDPSVLVDPQGRLWLYFATDRPHAISVVPLSPNGLAVAGTPEQVLGVDQPWEHTSRATVEGPSVAFIGDRYFMFYSGGDWRADYGMGYATAESPLGPFQKSGDNPIIRGTRRLVSPGGGSVFVDRGGNPWLAYHAWTRGLFYTHGGVRALRLAKLRVRGTAVRVVPLPSRR